MTEPINDLIGGIRDYINTSWKHYGIRQDKAKFAQLGSALDTIEDAESAIFAFNSNDVGENTETLYLITYGLMQAFFVQQDAVQHLCEALGIENTYSNFPRLSSIREIRNDSVGHPTKRKPRKGTKATSYHQISQMTMSKQGFQMISRYSDGSSQFSEISIPPLIADQNRFIAEMLRHVLEKLKAEFKAHKEKFRMEKLVPIFPQILGYAFEKARGELWHEPDGRGLWGLVPHHYDNRG